MEIWARTNKSNSVLSINKRLRRDFKRSERARKRRAKKLGLPYENYPVFWF